VSRSIDELLADARAGLQRVTPAEARAATENGALLVDIRPAEQRARDGSIRGAVIIDRNVLEWRLDPASPHRIAQADDYDRPVVIICDEGYASSLAAATLQRIGLDRATDVIGGFQAWRRAGLPVESVDTA
jgi:rhodanese-related sulfurtransferase